MLSPQAMDNVNQASGAPRAKGAKDRQKLQKKALWLKALKFWFLGFKLKSGACAVAAYLWFMLSTASCHGSCESGE